MSGSSRTLLSYFHRLAGPAHTDATLLARWRDERDQDAFALLMARHGPMVLGICRRILGDVQDAEDVFQATFLVLGRKAAHLRRPEAVVSFLYGVAVRLARKARASAKRRKMVQPCAEAPEPVDPHPQPLDVLTGRELLALLDAEIARLPETYRLPLLLCLLQGRTVEDAARQLGCSIGSLRGRLERGREQLRRRLSRRGLGLSVAAIGLLAPAVVPEKLLAESLGQLNGPVSAAVRALAGGMMPAVRLKIIGLALVLVTAVGLGAGLSLRNTPETQTPIASAQAEPQAHSKNEPRLDRYGDPLPPGAVARLGTIRFRHPFWVSGLAFTPDGKTLASACWDGSVRLWDAATGKETQCFRCPPHRGSGGPTAFTRLALSPDGKTIIAMGNGEKAYMWDRITGKELRSLKGPRNNFGLSLSPDGKTVAIGDGGGEVQLWDAKAGKPTRAIKAGNRLIGALAFSPDSEILACADHPLTDEVPAKDWISIIRLWDAASGRPLRELKGHTGEVTAVTFSRNGRTLVSVSHDATLRFWDTATGKQMAKLQVPDETDPNEHDDFHHQGINCGGLVSLTYSPDGRLLASGGYDGTVRIWDAGSGKELHVLRGHGREVASVIFSPDGKILASGGHDQTIRLWDANSGEQLQPRQGHDGPVGNLAVSPDGRLVAAACHDHTVRLWSVADRRQLHVLSGHTGMVYDVAFAPDGRAVATASADHTLRLWDIASGREIRQFPKHGNAVYSVAFTPVRNMLISGEANGMLHFWDRTTGEQVRQVPELYSNFLSQVTSDGQILGTAGRNAVHLLDVKTGKELRRFAGAWPRFGLSLDGRTLAIQSSGEKIQVRNVATGEEIGRLADSDSPPGFVGVKPFAFSPDGRLLARIGKGDIELWEVLTGKLRRRFQGHQGGVRPLAFSPDGKTLISGGNDTTVLIWDVARQQEQWPDRLSSRDLQILWGGLAVADAEKADQAICTLALTAEQSLPFLKRHLLPARIADQERLTRLIADLDSTHFIVRERAEQELQRLGEQAESALREALKEARTLETRRRMEGLLSHLREVSPTPELLRTLRATEALERIGTPEARLLLESLAKGAQEARLTREAKESLKRLNSRNTSWR